VRRLLGLACAALIGLSACGSAPTPIEPTTKSSAPNATPSGEGTSTLKPPTLPAAAKRNDETGAANFVNYWVKVSNYAARTGDLELLRSLSASDCVGCNRYIDLYEKTYEAGGYFRRGDRRLEAVQVQSDQSGTYVTADLLAAPGLYRNSSELPEKSSPADRTRVTFLAQRRGSSWIMVDVGLSGS
jgi:hypothetical protein